MKVLICAGGSGGGVYPALSVWQTLRDQASAVLWVGGKGGMEEGLVVREGIRFEKIPAAGLHGVGLRALPGNLLKLIQGVFEAAKIIKRFQPDVMLFTGGYVAVPVALAGRKTPILLYVPDIEPGLALKILSRFADVIALIADESKKYFPGRHGLHVTGHPVRNQLQNWTRERANAFFDLNDELPTLFVFGGSKGARSINQAVVAFLPELLAAMQVVHISGSLDWQEIQLAKQQLPADLAKRYKVFEYLHDEMGAAYAAADLVLSRSGASSVGEFPLFGLPAILVPYPYAWRYQKVNADYLVKAGAAVLLEDRYLRTDLKQLILDLLQDTQKLQGMSDAMRSLANPSAATDIKDLMFKLASKADSAT